MRRFDNEVASVLADIRRAQAEEAAGGTTYDLVVPSEQDGWVVAALKAIIPQLGFTFKESVTDQFGEPFSETVIGSTFMVPVGREEEVAAQCNCGRDHGKATREANKTIYLKTGLAPGVQLQTLAHEIGHALRLNDGLDAQGRLLSVATKMLGGMFKDPAEMKAKLGDKEDQFTEELLDAITAQIKQREELTVELGTLFVKRALGMDTYANAAYLARYGAEITLPDGKTLLDVVRTDATDIANRILDYLGVGQAIAA